MSFTPEAAQDWLDHSPTLYAQLFDDGQTEIMPDPGNATDVSPGGIALTALTRYHGVAKPSRSGAAYQTLQNNIHQIVSTGPKTAQQDRTNQRSHWKKSQQRPPILWQDGMQHSGATNCNRLLIHWPMSPLPPN